MTRITAKIEQIDPRRAAAYLKTMGKNRRVKDATVSCYATDMARGKWLLSPQGIAFDEAGALFDGQHRLHAIVQAGVSVPLLVLRGFPAVQAAGATMDVVDGGCGRSLADRLRLMGAYHGNPALSSGAARAIARLVVGSGPRAVRRLSLASVVGIMDVYKREMTAVMNVMDRSRLKHIRNVHAVAAFTVAATANVGRVDIDMGRFASGAGLAAGSPLLALREMLMGGTAPVQGGDKAALILAALHAEWEGLPAARIAREESMEAARAYFRATQRKRFESIENMFRVRSETEKQNPKEK